MVVQLLDHTPYVSQSNMQPRNHFICNKGPFKPSSVMQMGHAVSSTSSELYFSRLNTRLLTTTGWWTGFWATKLVDRLAFAPRREQPAAMPLPARCNKRFNVGLNLRFGWNGFLNAHFVNVVGATYLLVEQSQVTYALSTLQILASQ